MLSKCNFFFWPHTRRSACVAHKCIQDSSSSVETPWSNAKPWFSLSFHTKRHTCILVYKMEKRYIMCLVVAYSWSEKESSLLFIVFYRSTWLIFNGKWLTYEKEGITCEKNLIQVKKTLFFAQFSTVVKKEAHIWPISVQMTPFLNIGYLLIHPKYTFHGFLVSGVQTCIFLSLSLETSIKTT